MTTIRRHPWKLSPTPREHLPTSNDLDGLVHVRQMDGGQEVSLGVLTAAGGFDDSNRVLHIQSPWSETVLDRPDAGPRSLAFAQAIGAEALVIDTPGIGAEASRLPRGIASHTRRGDLRSVAQIQEPVMEIALNAWKPRELYGLGSSQGSAMLAASMATAPEGARYDGAIFYEPVGLERQNALRFIGGFATDTILDSTRLAAYRAETPGEGEYVPGNPEHMRKLAKAIMRHPGYYSAYVAAMAKDALIDDITAAYERGVVDKSSQLVFVTGTSTHVSPIERLEVRLQELSKQLGLGGLHLVTLEGENHGMYESTGRMHAMLSRIGSEIFRIAAPIDAE